ncbi:MAG TPA: ABC transporter ATP-binding protein [Gammaproteobacteria bacterium]|nr:ABC transporter ATP-binding protein [Gammaproteobacteria bacterium]HPI96140.1 ABC transporter ATP-binding protein [Gammaproteobacteria bacterium]HPQ86181.1 ABC transporter ATP-binding protein [Gammaproteobacteria bacterium]
MIEVRGLSKIYGSFQAVNNVNFVAKAGEIFGLLGPNGAGKSTTINCISGLISPTDGSVLINGHNITTDSVKAKQSLGLVPQELALYEDLSAYENLVFWGSAYGLSGNQLQERIQQVLNEVGLETRQKDAVNQFSGGMKRRLNFACAVLHKPAALLLDEPTVGIDPQSREHLMQAILKLKEQGTAVIYTTHYMEEAERLCDNLAIIDKGEIIATGTVDALRSQLGERDLITFQGQFQNPESSELESLGAEILEQSENEIRLLISDAPKNLSSVMKSIESQHGKISNVNLAQANLESLFIKLTGRALRDAA